MRRKLLLLLMVFIVSLCPIVSFAAQESDEYQKEDLERQRSIDAKPVYLTDEAGEVTDIEISTPSTRIAVPPTKPSGTYPKVKGAILYTKDTTVKVAKVVGHAAIVFSPSKVVEATASGVKLGGNDWHKKDHCRAGIVSGLSTSMKNKVADKCSSWRGKPYNWDFAFVSTRSKFYCSQLVWAGYKDVAKVNLNSGAAIVFPSELIKHKSVKLVYRKG